MINWTQLEKYFAAPGTNIPLIYQNNSLIDQHNQAAFHIETNYIDFLCQLKHKTDNLEQLEYWESNTPNLRLPEHPVQTQFAEQRFSYLEKIIPFNEIQSALDIGCGNGVGTISLKKRVNDVIGLDMSSYLLKQIPNSIAAIRADATKLPLTDNAVDLSMAWELIHHIIDPIQVFEEMKRVTKKWIIIFEPNRLNPLQAGFSLAVNKERLGLRNSKQFLVNLVNKTDLELIHYSTVGCIFPNKMPAWMVKLLKIIPFKIPLLGISHLLVAKVK